LNRFLRNDGLQMKSPRALASFISQRSGGAPNMSKQLPTKFSGPYTFCYGRPVALRLVAAGLQTTLHCTVLGESNEALRIRIAGIWEIDIFKEMIKSVEPIQPSTSTEFTAFPDSPFSNRP
jgi:hypothetical protein